MLKRRASKRFVLAETGEINAWDTTMDNDRAPVTTQAAGYRRDSIVDGVPPPPALVVSSALPVTPMLSVQATEEEGASDEGKATSVTDPDAVVNQNQATATPIADGNRLAVAQGVPSLIHGGSLK